MWSGILKACFPIIDLIIALAYPLAYIGIGTGFLLWTANQRQWGTKFIKNGIVGFLGIKFFLPVLMSILKTVGETVGK